MIGNQNLTFDEYGTLLTQVEACVNSRPITAITDDLNDLTALTPAHFLIGQELVTLPEPRAYELDKTSYLKRWELVQKFNQDIWKRWYEEYITSLINRPKWRNQVRNLKINDLVIIKENNMPPSKWHTGRIIKTHPSQDGLIRAVTVRTLYGEYVRPIVKLGLLYEFDDDHTAQPNEIRPVTDKLKINLSKLYDKMLANKNASGNKPTHVRNVQVKLNRLTPADINKYN